jgi:hypothetical protein
MPASAKASSALILTLPSDREIIMTRVFDAPRRLVFEAWSKPEHVLPHRLLRNGFPAGRRVALHFAGT